MSDTERWEEDFDDSYEKEDLIITSQAARRAANERKRHIADRIEMRRMQRELGLSDEDIQGAWNDYH